MTSEPKYTPKSELTLSAGPEDFLADSGALTEAISDPAARALARREPCACGGEITALPADDIAPRVALHNRSLQHWAWRWARDITESELRALSGDR